LSKKSDKTYCELFFFYFEELKPTRTKFTQINFNIKKLSKTNKDLQSQEFFSLQISDEKAFFISENSLKFDSIFKAKFTSGQGRAVLI